MSVSVDMSGFERKMRIYRGTLNRSAPELFREQAGKLFEDLTSAFPPRSEGQRDKAEKRVWSGINRAIERTGETKWEHPELDRVMRKQSVDALNIILDRSRKKSGYARIANAQAIDFDKSIYYGFRGPDGKVRTDGIRRITMQRDEHRALVASIQKHVGWLKSGWQPARRLLGNSHNVPAVVARHTFMEPGDAKGDLRNENYVWIEARNEGKSHPGLRLNELVQWVMRRREGIMMKRMEYLMREAKSKAAL